ncbi:expressed unknown protein [Seminavis robusta]|uniref:Uncharacterized protein n=1 Tax=Seminavis robusta TaxID=568900 RepID=A0A9N8EHS9_9STRA|nr:expressed unknown protein [Seminavis robusta]|eukprot:Sro1236_g255130.1 n/a (247) ;mRNA; r:17608-18348
MVSAASLNIMETSAEHTKEEPRKLEQPTGMDVTSTTQDIAPADAARDESSPMAVPEQIVVDRSSSSSTKKDRSHRRKSRKSSSSNKEKDKVAAKRKSSSGKHKKRRESSGNGETKEQRRSRRRSRKSSKSSDPDPNDPATIAKSRELLLAAMGVKKQPDIEPCFVSAKTSLDSNPVYQRNKERLAKSVSESHLSTAHSEAEFSFVAGAQPMETSRSTDNLSTLAVAPHQHHGDDSHNSEYDQFVDF